MIIEIFLVTIHRLSFPSLAKRISPEARICHHHRSHAQ